MNEIVFFTDVKPDGKIQNNVSQQMREAMPQFEGKRIYIKIGIAKKIRSLSANAFYWKIVIECTIQGVKDLWGETISKDQAHLLLGQNCNFEEKLFEISDGNVRIPKETHNMSSSQFGEYTERCLKFIAENFNITVPEPGSQAEVPFNENND
jgi:hypothetical protein